MARAALLLWLSSFTAIAQETPNAPVEATPIAIAYIGGTYPKPEYLSLLQKVPDDLGAAGARLALKEINITGRFLGRTFEMQEVRLTPGRPLERSLGPILAKTKLIVADLETKDLLALADLPAAKDAVILDMRTQDDVLRGADCRYNTFHLLPSTAMRTDALAQYLMEKRWPRWFLLRGTSTEDSAYAADVERSAKKFGAKIVEARSYGYNAGSRRVDTGYQQIQTQMPLATRNAPVHDVTLVADVADVFGDYLPYATSEPRPVVGTQGLVATAWSPAFQEYSALQMQHRFETEAHRPMQEGDYGGWLAIRIVGEAVIRSKKTDAASLGPFLRSTSFEVAGFKGQSLTFRPWDQQLRQPVLLASALMVVSMSPQEGFLHPKYLTDSLGTDESESQCRFAR